MPGYARVRVAALPNELRSSHFTATVDGHPADVAHAAANYYFLSFDVNGSARISITAAEDGFWDRGVEVQPWRFNIRPTVQGRTITFTVRGAAKLSISRPGDHLGGAEMVFLFANPPEQRPPRSASTGLRYYGPGEHHENIDARSGDNIYLAPGAVVYGSLNLWEVENVHVFGRGVIIYDGPQDPDHDQGWMHKKDWHVIVMHDARHISIEGITCVVRSRTWMIQMRDSHDVRFENIKVIGGSPGNANQDGMDWLGGGDTVVKDVFIRAADDIFAMYGNWDGYGSEAFAIPGHDVNNITIEDSVLSTSISNVVRVGWPQKMFNSQGFIMRNTDVIHMGLGSCGIPFALMELWATPGGKGQHADYLFDDIRLEDWYSLVQLQQPNPGIRNVRFENIWALESPSKVASSLTGDVSGTSFKNVHLGGQLIGRNHDLPVTAGDGVSQPEFENAGFTSATITYTAGALKPRQQVAFTGTSDTSKDITSWEWIFGDGSLATGRKVRHKFPDDHGTLQDGSGRFRVLLKTTDSAQHTAWAYAPVVVSQSAMPAKIPGEVEPGLAYQYSEERAEGPTQQESSPASAAGESSPGIVDTVSPAMRKRSQDYSLVFDGFVTVPTDGGYTFTLLANDAGSLTLDGRTLATTPKPWPLVCGSPGNAVQAATGSAVLKAGRHAVHISATHTRGEDGLALRWQGPGLPQAPIPASAFSHTR